MSTTASAAVLRDQFFGYLFGDDNPGYFCLAIANKDKSNFRQRFFEWPKEKHEVNAFIDAHVKNHNIWFCVNLLRAPERKKEYALPATFAWADLDQVEPSTLDPYPSMVVQSSPGRYQAFWRIAGDPVPADVAEDFSRRIAYKFGADKSGWDLTQLLRVPLTFNYKYSPEEYVQLLDASVGVIPVEVLDAIEPPTVNGDAPVELVAMPDPATLPTADNVIYKYKAEGKLNEHFIKIYVNTPDEGADWSKVLWRFVNMCFEAGMTDEEVFAVSLNAACNKYERDNRPITYLWRDVSKASKEYNRFEILAGLGRIELVKMPQLVNEDMIQEDAFIKNYKDWANQATDAPEQYHELTCFIALSAIMCSGLYLKVEWGEIVPNIWGMVLGESTLTRKTTAMRMAIDILKDIDPSLILATDGSAEGLLTGLSHRPKRVSIFWKDEVSGLFDAINKKDYLAGLPETLTQLYDGGILTRLLRKETITISDPYFIFFGGGIRDKVYSLLNDEYILSGFLPRFLVVSGENDISRVRRTGPPTMFSTERKDNIVRTLSDLRERYNVSTPVTIAGQTVEMPSRIEAQLSDEAWAAYGAIEDTLTTAGAEADMSMLALPTFTRLAFSILKMSLLVAASRREPSAANILHVERTDVEQAAYYVGKWGHYSVDLITHAGRGSTEKAIDRAMIIIKRREGLTKAEFMQRLKLSARDARDLMDTLIQRGLVDVKQHGRGHRLYSL